MPRDRQKFLSMDESVIEEPQIKNCPDRGVFKRQCPLLWENLKATKEELVRHCDQCDRSVHLIATDEELGRAVRLNQCIAIRVPEDLQNRKISSQFMMGEPLGDIGSLTRKLMCSSGE